MSLEQLALGNEVSVFTWQSGTWLCKPVGGELEIAWTVHREASWDWIASKIGTSHTQRGSQSHCHIVLIIFNRYDEKIVGEDTRGKDGPGLRSRSVPELGNDS